MQQSIEITISYETLFDLLRREKDKSELQKLPDSFLQDTADYVRGKQSLLRKNMSGAQGISVQEKQKVAMQLQNVRKILRDLYNRRESKIMVLAQNKVRSKSTIIDTSVMMSGEKVLYDSLTGHLERQRMATMKHLFSADNPYLSLGLFMEDDYEQPRTQVQQSVSPPQPAQPSVPKEITQVQPQKPVVEEKQTQAPPVVREVQPEKPVVQQEQTKSQQPAEQQQPAKTMLIRVLDAIPKFVGRDLQVYGPFQTDDMANLPRELAQILISKKKAEQVMMN